VSFIPVRFNVDDWSVSLLNKVLRDVPERVEEEIARVCGIVPDHEPFAIRQGLQNVVV
jgi:hypothetical protein